MTNIMQQTVIKNPTWRTRRSIHEQRLTVFRVSGFFWCIALVVGITVVTTAGAVPTKTEMLRSADEEHRRQEPTVQAKDLQPPPLPSTAEPLDGRLKSKDVLTVPRCVDNDTCFLPGCIHTASSVLKNMDPEIEPCDDFYKFACGGFLKATRIPDDKQNVDIFSVLNDKVQDQLAVAFEAKIEPNEIKPFRLVKTLYKTCMDEASIEKQGLESLKDLLKRLGGWPVIDGDSWKDGDFDWKNTTYKFRDVGGMLNYFIVFNIGVDMKNSTTRVITLDQATLGLPRESLMKGFDDDRVQAYYNYTVDIAVIMGADKDRAMSELKESLLFEIKLANISLPNVKRRNATQLYNPMTLTNLTKKYPSVPWRQYFSKLFPPSIAVEENEIAIVYVPSYFSDFEKLISLTPKRVQANYIMSRFAKEWVPFLNEEVRKIHLAYATGRVGTTKRASRSQECIGLISRHLRISVGAMYARKYFHQEAKKNAVEIVMNIRQEFTKILKQAEWMDEKARQSALEKVASMSSYIAYPDELLDDDKLEEMYQKLELSEGNYLESIMNLTNFDNENNLRELRKPVNKSEWVRHGYPAFVNAFYSRLDNSIQFPAGVLQGAFFSNDRPRYMNYGATGYAIGHEITHSFSGRGKQFDNLAPSTKENYLKRAECIIHQYGNYTDEEVGLKLNGTKTQSENIADNGGIKEAYLAYNNWVARNGPEQRLPGLQKYTPNQMFWISAATTWCEKYRPEKLRNLITTGSHSPSKFRIIGPLSNMPEFAKDFGCPIGSKMNPEKKCSVW